MPGDFGQASRRLALCPWTLTDLSDLSAKTLKLRFPHVFLRLPPRQCMVYLRKLETKNASPWLVAGWLAFWCLRQSAELMC
jgi:hypothetical protein